MPFNKAILLLIFLKKINALTARPLLLLGLLLLLVACPNQDATNKPSALRQPDPRVITFVTHNGPTTYYRDGNGNLAGLEYDLATLFVQKYAPGYRAEFVLVNSISDVIPTLLKGKAHIAAADLSITPTRQQLVQFSTPYFETQQQLIYNDEINKKPKSLTTLGAQIYVPRGTSFAERLEKIQQKEPTLRWGTFEKTNAETLLESVAHGELDYTIADSHLAAIMHNYYPQLAVAMPVGETEKIAWAMLKNREDTLSQKVNLFFKEIRKNGMLRNLLDRYYGNSKRLNALDITTFLARVNTLLPKYKPLFIQAQEITGFDWRLLAAVSYRESHWDTFNTSPTNVRGLMMLTESTADLMGVTDRLDPKQSIPAGAKYLLQLKDGLPERIPEPDRTYMALAAYNVGIAHLEDARVLAQRQKLNPDSWADIKKTLVMLNNPEYYTTVKYGYASGGAPVIFVETIRSYARILERYQPSHQESADPFKIELGLEKLN